MRTGPGSDSSGSIDVKRVQIRPSRSQQRKARCHKKLAYFPRSKTSSVAALHTHNFWNSLELDASPGEPDSNSSGKGRTRSPVGDPTPPRIPAKEKIGPRGKKESPTAPGASQDTPSSESPQEEPEAKKADSTDAERLQSLKALRQKFNRSVQQKGHFLRGERPYVPSNDKGPTTPKRKPTAHAPDNQGPTESNHPQDPVIPSGTAELLGFFCEPSDTNPEPDVTSW